MILQILSFGCVDIANFAGLTTYGFVNCFRVVYIICCLSFV